jgi:mRNA interferase HigB
MFYTFMFGDVRMTVCVPLRHELARDRAAICILRRNLGFVFHHFLLELGRFVSPKTAHRISFRHSSNKTSHNDNIDTILGTLILTWKLNYGIKMHVITRGKLQAYWSRPGREDAEEPLKSWYAEAKSATWKSPADIKAVYPAASIVADNRVIFNIGGNKHRLVVHVNYGLGIILIKFIGSHREYDAIDAVTIGGGKNDRR